MDKTVKIKIIRASDSSTFEIGDGSYWKLKKDGLDGFGSIENVIGFSDNATADGGIITGQHITKKDRTIQCAYIYPSNNDVARKRALAFFNVKDSFKVYFTYGERTVWATGIVYKLALPHTANVKDLLQLTITFMFANPFWKSNDDFGKNIAAIRGMTAFPFLCNPDNGGTTGGMFNFAQEVTLYNDGDVETTCKVQIVCDGEVTNPKIIINDEYVRIISTLAKGDTVEMDFTASPPTVTINDVSAVGKCDRTSAFDSMILNRGDNLISYTADNGSSNMTVNVYYNKLYEAI